MGKGDKKSKRGKIHIGSFGVRRPRKKGKKATTATTVKSTVTKEKKAPAKKAASKKAASK